MRTVLRLPSVGRFFAGGLLSVAGDWMLLTALPFHVLVLTGSTAATSAMFVAFAAPRLLFSLIGGVLTDRFDRRRLMVGCDVARAVLLLPLLLVSGREQLWLVIAVTVVQSAIGQVFMPARNAVLPTLVPDPHKAAANSVDALIMGLTRLAGPVAGGALLAGLGLDAVVLIDAGSFLVSAALLASIRIPVVHNSAGGAARGGAGSPGGWREVRRDLRDGLVLLWRRRGPRAVMVTSVFVMLGYGLTTALGVVFVRVVLHGSAADFGWLMAAQGIGLTAGGLLVSRASARVPHRWLFAAGLLLAGVSLLLMYGSSAMLPVYLFSAFSGLGLASWMVGERTLMQRGIPLANLGVAFGAYNTLTSVLTLTGTAMAGVLAPVIGIRASLTTAAGAYLAPGIAVTLVLVLLARKPQPVRRRVETGG